MSGIGNGEKDNAEVKRLKTWDRVWPVPDCRRVTMYTQEDREKDTIKPQRQMLAFDTGATRNRKENELAYEGFLSPLALKMFATYMHHHRVTADGTVRDPDNWQKGMPLDSYMDSLLRHVMDLWLIHRGFESEARESLKEALAGAFFNLQGYMHTVAKDELG